MYFSNALQNTTSKLVENQHVITKVYFPRLMLPLSATLSGLVDFGISFLMFAVIASYYGVRFELWPGLGLLYFPILLLLTILLALGVGLWLSALNAVYRDVKYVLPFSTAVLDVRIACCLSRFADPSEMEMALRLEPHERGNRGIPLVAYRARRRAVPTTGPFGDDDPRDSRERRCLFSSDGNHHRGRGVAMRGAAIQVEGLGKRYRVGEREQYRAFRNIISSSCSAAARFLTGAKRRAVGSCASVLWALQDVWLKVPRRASGRTDWTERRR